MAIHIFIVNWDLKHIMVPFTVKLLKGCSKYLNAGLFLIENKFLFTLSASRILWNVTTY